MSGRVHGKVKWYRHEKGYGFLERDDGGPDVFVHISTLSRVGIDTLRDGDRLSFEIEADRKDPSRHRAANVVAELQRTGTSSTARLSLARTDRAWGRVRRVPWA